MLFDSHAHLDDKRFDTDRHELIKEIHSSGVTNIINIGEAVATSEKSVALAEQYDFIYAAVGVHPHNVQKMTDADLDKIKNLASHQKVVAIGEIGLDYHYDYSDRESQRKWFKRQLELTAELNLPVIIHDRESGGECIEILKEKRITTGVMHCYSGSAQTAKTILDMGLYISFTGVITFSNARKAIEALEVIPMDKLLIETDCPYLTPEPFRGQRNHSGYVRYVAQKVAEVKGLSFEEVAKITAENTKRLFNINMS